MVPAARGRHAVRMAYRRQDSRSGLGEGWYRSRPETVAIAQPSDDLDVRIEKEHRGDGFVLTILNLALERGETSTHGTVEEAKKHAGAVLRLGLQWK